MDVLVDGLGKLLKQGGKLLVDRLSGLHILVLAGQAQDVFRGLAVLGNQAPIIGDELPVLLIGDHPAFILAQQGVHLGVKGCNALLYLTHLAVVGVEHVRLDQ